jgi:uncharacterized protein (UPF0548 family)
MQPDVDDLAPALAERLRTAGLTYPEVGQTGSADLPPGYHHVRRARAIGTGERAFNAAADAVLRWQVQARAGLRVQASSKVVTPGVLSTVRLGIGPFGVNAPCRVVYVVDEPRRKGFGYGTLPGHPESGEESFVVEWQADDSVVLHVVAFSRPATALSRLAGPAARLAQEHVTRRYLRALASS